MGFESDLERTLGDAGKSFEGWAEKSGQSLMTNWGYGFQEIMGYKYLKKEVRSIKYGNLAIVVCVTGALFFYAPELSKWMPAKVTLLGFKDVLILKLLHSQLIYKVLAVVVPGAFMNVLGARKHEEIQSYNDRFEMIGLSSGSKKTITDGEGHKIRVMAFPELIRRIEVNEDTDIYLFKPNGNSLDAFMKKRESLEQVFNTNIYKLDYTKSGKNVIQMVTVSDYKKKELVEQYEEQKKFNEKFERIGLVGQGNRKIKAFGGVEEIVRNFPEYLQTEESIINHKKVKIYSFRSEGTQLEDWINRKYLMENVMNELVVDITQDLKDKQLYRVRTISTEDDLKPLYKWDDIKMDDDEAIIVLGEGLLDKVTVNLNDLPHMLIAGTTNSGKSVLANCLIYQLVKKGWHFIGIDFKGGVEFQKFKAFGPVLFERKDVIEILTQLQEEYAARLARFKPLNVEKLSEYHKLVGPEDRLTRIVLVVDELAEMTEKTGDKSVDDEIKAIINQLGSLARLARATGIHIIAGTQRPDANVLGGQIKNNMSVRISGRMTDKEPSIMVLGSPAATRIPEIKGRYMMTTGSDITTFQGYFFEKSHIKAGDYRKGKFLVLEGSETDKKYDIRSVSVLEKHGNENRPTVMNLIDDEDMEELEEVDLYEERADLENYAEELHEGGEPGPVVVTKEILTLDDLEDPDED